MNSQDKNCGLRFRGKRSLVRTTSAALVVALSVAHTTPANALDPATAWAIVGYIKQAYDLFSTGADILNGGGPDLAAQLAAVEAALLNELRTQRNQQWRSQAEAAFQNFRILAARVPGDPSNPDLWGQATGTDTQTALNQYAIIATDGLDKASAHQLAPMYFSLVTTWVGLQKMKKQIYPGFPAQWVAYHLYLQQAMSAAYKLVGAHILSCWPGFNPGRGQFTSIPFDFSAKYGSSQLFDFVEDGRYYETDSAECFFSPYEKVLCFPAPSWSSCFPTSCTPFGFWPEFTAERRRIAREMADITHFSKDPVVIVVRAAMRNILDKVAGGNDPVDDANTSLPEDFGMLVDPWVDEPSCGAGAPWAYPSP